MMIYLSSRKKKGRWNSMESDNQQNKPTYNVQKEKKKEKKKPIIGFYDGFSTTTQSHKPWTHQFTIQFWIHQPTIQVYRVQSTQIHYQPTTQIVYQVQLTQVHYQPTTQIHHIILFAKERTLHKYIIIILFAKEGTCHKQFGSASSEAGCR